MKIRPVVTELFHADGQAYGHTDRQTDRQTDRHDEGNSCFLAISPTVQIINQLRQIRTRKCLISEFFTLLYLHVARRMCVMLVTISRKKYLKFSLSVDVERHHTF
jgi:hypothetical protein